jgi:hypothetical protein
VWAVKGEPFPLDVKIAQNVQLEFRSLLGFIHQGREYGLSNSALCHNNVVFSMRNREKEHLLHFLGSGNDLYNKTTHFLKKFHLLDKHATKALLPSPTKQRLLLSTRYLALIYRIIHPSI